MTNFNNTNNNNIIINFGNNLKNLRKENNITMQELSEQLGLSRQILSHYENGKKLPNLYSLIQISRFFNCSIDSLIYANTDIDISTLIEVPNEKMECLNKINDNVNLIEKKLMKNNTNHLELVKEIQDTFSQSFNLLENIHSIINEIADEDTNHPEK